MPNTFSVGYNSSYLNNYSYSDDLRSSYSLLSNTSPSLSMSLADNS